MTNQRQASSHTANQRPALTLLFLITILQTRGRCCIRMTSTWSLWLVPSFTIFIIKRKLPPPEMIKDSLKDKPNKSQVSRVLDMGQFQIRICVNLFFHLIYMSSCCEILLMSLLNPASIIQTFKYLSWNKYIVCVFDFDYLGFSVSTKFGDKTDTFKVLIKVVLATLSTTFEALLRTWDDLSFNIK